MKTLLTLVVVAVLAGGGWYYWKKSPQKIAQENAVPERYLATAELRDIDFSVEVSGEVAPANQLDVKPEVGGKIRVLHVEPGDVVKAGQLLVEIDDRDLLSEKESVMTEIDGARLTVEKNRRNYERGKELFESKLISQEVIDNLNSDYQIADNGLAKAQRRLQIVEDRISKTRVVSPMDGTVLTVPVIAGQVVIGAASVNSGTTLMNIANLNRLLVDTHVNQVDVARLALDQTVRLRAESLKDLDIEAKISFIAPVATVRNNVKGFTLQAAIDKPSPRLRPGMTVHMQVPIAHAADAVSVPVEAVFRGEGGSRVVWVVGPDGEAPERREVKIGVSSVEHAQILKGVREGEQIMLIEPDGAVSKKRSQG